MTRSTFAGVVAATILCLAGSAPGSAQLVGATNRSDIAGSTLDLSTLGAVYAPVVSGTVLSGGGLNGTLQNGGTTMYRFDQKATNCDWCGNFLVGESLLWTGPSSGLLTISFDRYLKGFGTNIMPIIWGQFTATLSAYDGTTLLGSYTASGVGASDPVLSGPLGGSALFLGVLSGDVASDFNRIELSVDAPEGLNFAINDPVVAMADRKDVLANPEPITMSLLGTGLLGLAGVARRRRARVQA